MATAAGFPRVLHFTDPTAWADAVPDLFGEAGPTFVHVLVEPGSEGPISRRPAEPSRYLQTSLAVWARALRSALANG